jgi:lysozyme family protein
MTDLIKLKDANVRRWGAAKLTRGPEFRQFAAKAVANKARYQDVERRSGVHWVFVAVSHYRESTMDFTRQLGQGDPLDKVSTHVPAGRGPFLGPKGFEDSAVDALVNCPPHASTNKDWSIGGLLTLLERYNGLAYANAGRPSPYIWSGTDQYKTGKVLVDHGPIEDVYPSGSRKGQPVVDLQLGCAGLIMAMMAIDPTIAFTGAAITQTTTLPPPPAIPAKPGTSTATKAGGAVVIAAGAGSGAVAAASQGWSWAEIGLSAFIAAGLVTAVVLLVKKLRS